MHKPLHGGVLVTNEIDATSLTLNQATEKLRVSRAYLSRLIHEHMGLNPEMALRLAKFLGKSVEMCLTQVLLQPRIIYIP